MFMQIIVALSWLALPVGLVCLADDWFLRPRRQIAALPQPARDPPFMAAAYSVLPILVGAAVLRLLVAERLDFALVLSIITILTGLVWGFDVLVLRARRAAAVRAAGQDPALLPEPATVDYARSFFPVALIVLLLRAFIFEPFRIPSDSMMPTLLDGDFIIVNKYTYGLRWPVVNHKFVDIGAPQRGDVVVFRYPKDPAVNYIKRLVGLPGDTIQVKGGQVYINGKALPRVPMADATGDLPDGNDLPVLRFDEQMPNGRQHVIQKAPTGSQADNTGVYVVPPHCYFMLGDNRDNSLDSRFDPAMPADTGGLASCPWDASLDQYLPPESGVGFVPEEDLVGKAQFILASWKPGASLLKPWTWIAIRTDRFFHALK
jgi:signal peptidase I